MSRYAVAEATTHTNFVAWRKFRLDTDDLPARRAPSSDAADQPAATNGNQQRIQLRSLFD